MHGDWCNEPMVQPSIKHLVKLMAGQEGEHIRTETGCSGEPPVLNKILNAIRMCPILAKYADSVPCSRYR